ncbi:DUF2971 domain-containing protein [Pseudomonas knackmussii]|uniref:DUF2971 domain-containing protein n=1 Tax=Pseudomonas knackmussii TaxID=65741 RepID=UPI003F4A3092
MKVYHFLKGKYALDAIANQRLKVARLNALNDPYECFHMEMDNYLARVTLKERKNLANRWYGLLCFSGDFSSPVQWAHYSESHAGVCLGFEVPSELLLKVDYSAERTFGAEFKDALDLKGVEFTKYMLSRKHEHWKCEDEYRLLLRFNEKVMDDRLVFEPFSEKLRLSEVFLGLRCGISRKEMGLILRNNGFSVNVSKMAMSEDAYKMVRIP